MLIEVQKWPVTSYVCTFLWSNARNTCSILNPHSHSLLAQLGISYTWLYLIANVNEIYADGSETAATRGGDREKKCRFNERHSNLERTQRRALLITALSIEFSPIQNLNIYFPFRSSSKIAWDFHPWKPWVTSATLRQQHSIFRIMLRGIQPAKQQFEQIEHCSSLFQFQRASHAAAN